ncbi:MAG: glycosyltransferase [Hyphomonadaceae bacterium]
MSAATTLVVISFYDRRPTGNLERLLASMQTHAAGAAFDVVVVVNRTSDAPLAMPASVEVLERENLGMNIGAWDHGWRSKPGYDAYLFLQDECYVVRENWLTAFLDGARDGGVGLIGESINPAWDKPWPALRQHYAGARMPDHTIDGRPADRVDVYLDFMRRAGVEPGASGRHLRSLVWFATRPTLQAIDGFPIGANYGECIGAEIAVSRKVEALGKRVEQVSPEEFRFIRHVEYNRDHPQAPFSHAPRAAPKPQSARAGEVAEKPAQISADGAVIFRVHSASPNLASTRYRALMPALGLDALGLRTIVTDSAIDETMLRACRCIIFAKAIRPSDMAIAFEAHRLGAPIIIDLCDDMFIPDYGGGKGALYRATFKAMAEIAHTIVTTGPAMRDTLAALAPNTPIVVIPDQLETPDLLARVIKRPDAKKKDVTWRDRAAYALNNPGAALKRVQTRLGLAPPPTAKSAPPPSPPPPAAAAPKPRTIIWFGNHGAEHSAFGMGGLTEVLPHLSAVAKTHNIKLLVVSNSRDKFNHITAGADFRSEYREWSAPRIFADLDEADICLIPMPRERFALGKSANRIALALSRNCAVIANDFPALAPFHGSVVLEDWAGGLQLYLDDEERRQHDIARGKAVIAAFCSPEAVAKAWADLIESLPERTR